MSNCSVEVYKCHDKGLLMPFVNEYTWRIEVRAALYFIGLLWCFLGVAIIADIFMCAIEKITSKTRSVKVASRHSDKGYEEIEVRVWNDTVANLTLMALGSSAPEILLSCIEIVLKNNFHSGDLGPSTIVGSASFNLLVITAVCVMVIPSPDIRRIKHIKVFLVTAVFSIFAYIWLIIILVLVSPDFVELWEAVLTLIFFPLLVIIAYLADRDICGKKQVDESSMEIGFDEKASLITPDGHVNEEAMREFIKELGKNPELTEEDVAKLAAARMQESQHHDRLWYRINATRSISGSTKLIPGLSEKLSEIVEEMRYQKESGEAPGAGGMDFSEGGSKAVVEFTATRASVLERDQRVRVGIRRYGKLSSRVIFRVETIDGTAEAKKDYHPIKQTMVFEKDETYKYIDVEIIDDNEWEPDEVFFVKLSLEPGSAAIVGKKSIMEITIINDDEPGTFEFAKPSLLFKESAGKALIPIERSNGADGRVTVSWKTEDMTAKSGVDYDGGEGTIVFEHGETTKMLEIPLHDDQTSEKDESFKILLTDIDCPGAVIGRTNRTIVTIVNDDEFNGMVSRLVDMTNMNVDALRVDTNTWADQFRNAMNVNGGDLESATHLDYLMHFLTFGWKIIFACCPPPSIWGGWLSFCVALIMIGVLTAIVGDLASIFGCLVGLKDVVTAITFVALGTSLPDLFASKQAATQEKHADTSIGNVTGSNSVNVFLGLGLPWTIAAAYWTAKGTTFEVKAGSLAFSVVLYTVAAVLCIGFLLVRRFVGAFGKSELGGASGLKIVTGIFFIILWLLYILLSSLQAYDHIKVNF